MLCQNNKEVLDEFISRAEETLSDRDAEKRLAKSEKELKSLESKLAKLVDMHLEGIIDKENYEVKYFTLSTQIDKLKNAKQRLKTASETEYTTKQRIIEFRQTLEQNKVLDTFDRHIFESIIDKVVVGGYDKEGNKDPAMLTFVYKTGLKNSVDSTIYKPQKRNLKSKKNNINLYQHAPDDSRGDNLLADMEIKMRVRLIGIRYS